MSGQDIIPAPPSIVNNPPGAVNTAQQAFNERQDVTLPRNVQVDQGTIPSGTMVSSHMIFLNTVGTDRTPDPRVVWTFDGAILGVTSDALGILEAAASDILGAPGTVYPSGYVYRGLETVDQPACFDDSYQVSGSSITVSMCVGEPGDWIRVLTASNGGGPASPAVGVPAGTVWGLTALALLLLGAVRVHLRRHA